jgi:lipoprotein-anchoring transpeptidase ErfK/SrfK
MESSGSNPKRKGTGLRVAHLAFASLAALIAANDLAVAASLRNEQSVESRPAGEPIMAIVSLRDQQITVYDANGWIMRAPVSSGQKGRETPAGIFSVLQKDAEHYSNMYDDAYMPHMQRLTWSGIALHGGPVPGYPASHGCIRMPYDFAERLFDATRLGMRVIVAPSNVAPVAIGHPALFQPKASPEAASASAVAAEADEAASKADQARLAAVTASREAALSMVSVRKVEILKLKAEAELADTERAIASAIAPEAKEQAEDIRAKVNAWIAELEGQLVSAKAEVQPKLDAVMAAREAATAAQTASVVATEAARKAARDLEPVSVFISRKTQHLYIRQAFQPILEIPVSIQDPDRPIGTHIFTAMERTGTNMRWSVVSLVGGPPNGSRDEPSRAARNGNDSGLREIAIDPSSAKAALDRIAIPQDTVDRIAAMISTRSSLIISDEALSSETGNDTEFVVVMSDEPQGGLKHRRPYPQIDVRYDRSGVSYWRSPIAGRW